MHSCCSTPELGTYLIIFGNHWSFFHGVIMVINYAEKVDNFQIIIINSLFVRSTFYAIGKLRTEFGGRRIMR